MAIRHRTRPDGPWQVVLPGVYLDRGGQLMAAQRATAAYLYAGRASAVTGPAALAWHGVPVKPTEFVDVLVPLSYQRGNAGFARLRRSSLPPRASYTEGAVTYACVDRAIVDAARQMTDLADVRAVVAAGVQRGKVHVMQLAEELNRGPTAGSARLRMALAEVADGVRSIAEADLLKIIMESRLPAPPQRPPICWEEVPRFAGCLVARRRTGGRSGLQGLAPLAFGLGAHAGQA